MNDGHNWEPHDPPLNLGNISIGGRNVCTRCCLLVGLHIDASRIPDCTGKPTAWVQKWHPAVLDVTTLTEIAGYYTVEVEVPPVCVCGCAKVGAPIHSPYCPVANDVWALYR